MPSISLWLWLALGQAPDASDESLKTSKVVVTPSTERRQLSYEKEVWCVQLPPTTARPSGRVRIQCDDATKECLVAGEHVLIDGVEGEEELLRTQFCQPLSEQRVLGRVQDGFTVVEAVAEAPDGWYRDERGRIVQVNFDLHRRVYFGGAWAPQ